MTNVLEQVADDADQVADDQRKVARRARAMQRQRDRGWSWQRILERDGADVLGLLRHGAKRLTSATGHLGAVLARGLAAEGESRRRIASRLGVTHQRVSALLRSDRGA